MARLCARLGAPHPYLALASIASPMEADVDRVAQAYARNPALTLAMRELAEKKARMTEQPIDRMTRFDRESSGGSAWRIGELRFAAALELPAPARSEGAVFRRPGGRAILFAAAADHPPEAGSRAPLLGPAARVFEVRSAWSLPDDAWLARNPELWKHWTATNRKAR